VTIVERIIKDATWQQSFFHVMPETLQLLKDLKEAADDDLFVW